MADKIQTMIPRYGELNRIYRDYIDNRVFSFDSYLFDCLRSLSDIRISCHADNVFNGCNFVKYLCYLSETKKIIPNFVYY